MCPTFTFIYYCSLRFSRFDGDCSNMKNSSIMQQYGLFGRLLFCKMVLNGIIIFLFLFGESLNSSSVHIPRLIWLVMQSCPTKARWVVTFFGPEERWPKLFVTLKINHNWDKKKGLVMYSFALVCCYGTSTRKDSQMQMKVAKITRGEPSIGVK